MDTSANLIIENAERLFKDAEILAAAGSYRTAISLAVLSLEESGKACLVRWKKEGHIKRSIDREIRSGHIDKHLIFGAYRMVLAVLSVGKIVKRGEDDTPTDHAFVEIITKALHDKAMIPRGTVETGLLDHFKQDGFYIDLDVNLEAVAPSVPYDAEWFNMIAEYSREALEMARADSFTHQITAIIYNANRPRIMSANARSQAVKRFREVTRKLFPDVN
jgi:AbiV family abortive infection protein